MAADGNRRELDEQALTTLVPRLAYELIDRHRDGEIIHEEIEGTLLSADISGFTRLTEQLANRGREGAEIMTTAVNSCFADLIAAAEFHGGDVLKFGGDAVLVFYTGEGHRVRAAAAGQEMQFALRHNSHARRHSLLMTVGVADGRFDAMIVGTERRDLLLSGAATTHTLELEDGAEKGEVVVAHGVSTALGSRERAGGIVVLDDRNWLLPEHPSTSIDTIGRFVPDALRAHWVDYADLGAEHRQAAIGFVMIGGVDAHLAEHGGLATAEALTSFIDAVHAALDTTSAVLLHSDMAMGGVKLLVGAGVPSAIDDPADALLHASIAMSQIDTPFVIRQGLNIGTVFAGFLGAPHRRTLTVMSDVVNTAARMLGPAGPGEVVAVDALVARARGEVRGEPLEPLRVKGKETLVHAQRVDQLLASGQRAEFEVDFTGRADELEELSNAIDRGKGVTIVGPTGSGKSRLAEEAIESEGTVETAGGRYMTATPYGAFWAGTRALLAIDGQLSAPDAGTALDAWIRASQPELAAYSPLLAPIFGGELPETETVGAIEAEFRREILHDKFTELLASHKPAVTAILLEDTQWLDDASRDLVEHLQGVAHRHGWVVVQSRRGPSDAATDDQDRDITIELGPLDAEAIAAIITQASQRQLLTNEIARLVERADGNPLFALELARAVSTPGEEIPGSIEEVVAARIDQLSATGRRAVRLASVLGARFQASSFTALAAASGYDVEPDVASIEEIFDADDVEGFVRFRQLLYQDVAYASLPFNRRKRLHQAIGTHLEATAEDLDAISALLSHHFNAAGVRTESWKYSVQAARRATRQNSPGDAITLFERAVGFAPRGLPANERSTAFEGLGHAHLAAGNLEQANDAFSRARRLTDNPSEGLRLLCLQGDCRNRQGRFPEAMRTFTKVLGNSALAPAEQATALIGRGSVYYKTGRIQLAFETGNQAHDVARDAGLDEPQGWALNLIAGAAERLGLPDVAATALTDALAIFRGLEALSAEAEIHNNLGVSAQLSGDLAMAANSYERSLVLKERVGDLGGAAMVRMNLAEVQLDRGNTADVQDMLIASQASFERSGFRVGQAYTEGLLGRCAQLTGDLVNAQQSLETASRVFLELGAESYAAEMDLLLTEVLIDLGSRSHASALISLNRERLSRNLFESAELVAQRLSELEARAS